MALGVKLKKNRLTHISIVNYLRISYVKIGSLMTAADAKSVSMQDRTSIQLINLAKNICYKNQKISNCGDSKNKNTM